MTSIRVELISEKIIKPSSPTPSSLKSYKLSLFDQLTFDSYMPLATFYPNHHHNSSFELLESSLSKLLTSYYPFAGTLIDNFSIDCNDEGITFLEARINSSISEFLQEPDLSVQGLVFPSNLPWNPADKDNLVVAQLNYFDCGGIALAVCISHKLGDASTVTSFMSDWAAITRLSNEAPSPKFIGASIYPPRETPVNSIFEFPRDEHAVRRFVFRGEKIAKLKELVDVESGVENPTRVEVVTAFLYKSAMAASMMNSQSFVPSLLFQLVNLRRLTEPTLPQNSVGNIHSKFVTTTVDKGEIEFSRLVSKLRRFKVEFYEKCKRVKPNEMLLEDLENLEKMKEFFKPGTMEFYHCTSLCGFPLNNLDFGWGSPIKVALRALPTRNFFVLNDDNNGDGVEAIVTLDEKIMSIFESDEEFLAFASPY